MIRNIAATATLLALGSITGPAVAQMVWAQPDPSTAQVGVADTVHVAPPTGEQVEKEDFENVASWLDFQYSNIRSFLEELAIAETASPEVLRVPHSVERAGAARLREALPLTSAEMERIFTSHGPMFPPRSR